MDAHAMSNAFHAGLARRLKLFCYGEPCIVEFEVFEGRDVQGDGSAIVEQWWPVKLTGGDGAPLWFPSEGEAVAFLERNGLRDAYEARFDRRSDGTTYLRY